MSALDAAAVAAPGSAWEDVTELLGAAAKDLKVGQLVHVPDFNLFDSMSALELMDPKMDAGLALHGAAPLAVRDRVARGAVPLAFASARDVLATVDELFRAEAAWLGGQPLAQTLLTCVYMHREAALALLAQLVPPPQESQRDGSEHTERDDEDAEDEDDEAVETRVRARLAALGGTPRDTLLLVMAAAAAFTLRASAYVREVVVRADIYEEEDFSPGSAGQLDASPLADAGWSRGALELLLTAAIDRLEKLLVQERARVAAKGSAKKANKKKGAKQSKDAANAATAVEAAPAAVHALEGLDTNAKISALLCEALLRRLQLRRALHSVYSELGLAEKLADLERARTQFSAARELLKQIAAEALEFDAECFSGKPFGFDKTLSRLLMSGSPPRDVKAITTDEAVAIYDKLLGDWLEACSPGDWTMMEQVRVFLADFSRRRPNIVSRSFVLLLLYCEKKIYGRYSFMDWMTEEMVLNGVPSVLLSTQEGVQYSSRSIETVYESLKLYLHNRSRQRARIEYLLEEWAVLQLEAVAVDERFMSEMQIPKAAYPRYFTAWTLEQSTLLMIQYVLLGFELDLYAPNEYSTIYWYLDYLCGSRLQNLTFTWSFLERMKELMKGHPRRGGGAPSKPPATEDEATDEGSSDKPEDPAKARFEREIAYTEMLRSMMRAYFQAFAACEREERVNVAPPVYGSRVIRFQHRFAAFQSLHFPAALTYDDYLKNSDFSSYGVDLIYKSAEECFKVARGHGDELLSLAKTTGATAANSIHAEETCDVIRAAVANLVELARHEQDKTIQTQQQGKRRTHKPAANSASATPTTHAVALDFSKHPHFPVMSISRSGDQERR